MRHIDFYKNIVLTSQKTTGSTGGGDAYKTKYETLLNTILSGGESFTLDDDAITSVRNSAFSVCDALTSVRLMKCTQTEQSAFSYCANLTSVEMPVCSTLGGYTFSGCSALTDVKLPKLTALKGGDFGSCTSLKKLVLQACTTLDVYPFETDSNIEVLDILGGVTGSFGCDMGVCRACKALIIRATDGVTPLTGFFPFDTVSIYVPDALVEAYKSATNWSKVATQIKPLSTYKEV